MAIAGVLATVSGALLVVALLLDWWGWPSAFDNPADLPSDAAFAAEAVTEGGQELDADAFEFFGFRDLLWLAAGIVGFGFGVLVLALQRVSAVVAAAAGALALVAAVLVAAALISPPDFGDLGPASEPNPFSVDLPLSRGIGGFVALAAVLGIVVGAVVTFAQASARSPDRHA